MFTKIKITTKGKEKKIFKKGRLGKHLKEVEVEIIEGIKLQLIDFGLVTKYDEAG